MNAGLGIVFGGYMNYAIFGSKYKSNQAERYWACKDEDICKNKTLMWEH